MNSSKHFTITYIVTLVLAGLMICSGSASALDWTYSYDPNNDASGGSQYEVYRMGYAVDGDNLYFNMLTGLPQEGGQTHGTFDFTLSEQSFTQLSGVIPNTVLAEISSLQGIVFPQKNDLKAALNEKIGEMGVYWHRDTISPYVYYHSLTDSSLDKIKARFSSYDLNALDQLEGEAYVPKAALEAAVKSALGETVMYTLSASKKNSLVNSAASYAKHSEYWYSLTAKAFNRLQNKFRSYDLSALQALEAETYRSLAEFKDAVTAILGDAFAINISNNIVNYAASYSKYRVYLYTLTDAAFNKLQARYASYNLSVLGELLNQEYLNIDQFKAAVSEKLGVSVELTLSESTVKSIVSRAISYATKWYELTDTSIDELAETLPTDILAQLDNDSLKNQVFTSRSKFQDALKSIDPTTGYIETILAAAESQHDVFINAGDLYINAGGSHRDGYVLDAEGNPTYASGEIFGLALTSHSGDMNYDMQNSSGSYASGSKDDGYAWDAVTKGHLYSDATFSTGVYEGYKGAKAVDEHGNQLDGGKDAFGDENNAPVHIAEFGADLGYQGDVSWQKLSGATVVDEGGTVKYNVYEVNAVISLSALGLASGGSFELWWTMECGNDFHSVAGEVSGASPVPEPGTLLLLGVGLLSFLGVIRKRHSK